MAGSYKHATTGKGKLRNPETFSQMVENLGDAYETVEEMYGMIWMLANTLEAHTAFTAAELVEGARKNYPLGLEVSPGVQK